MNEAVVINDMSNYARDIDGDAMLFGIMTGLYIFLGVIFILAIIQVIASFKLFSKAGVPGWYAIIPIYSSYVMIELAFNKTKNWLIAVPIATFLFGMYTGGAMGLDGGSTGLVMVLLSLASMYIQFEFFKRYASVGMSIAAIFIPFIILPIIAFSNKYKFTQYTKEQDLFHRTK